MVRCQLSKYNGNVKEFNFTQALRTDGASRPSWLRVLRAQCPQRVQEAWRPPGRAGPHDIRVQRGAALQTLSRSRHTLNHSRIQEQPLPLPPPPSWQWDLSSRAQGLLL